MAVDPYKRIVRFDGGISDDPRQPATNAAALVKHFDVFSNPFKLTPYRSTVADANDGSTATGIKQYDVRHIQLGSNGKLYGLGKNGSGYPKVVSKTSPTAASWTLEATAEGNAARIPECFIEWQGAWWFFQGTNQIGKWAIGGTVTQSVATVGTTINTVAQGVIGSDNNLYLFYNNKVARVSPAGIVTDDVCAAIPSDMRITSVTRWGSYLMIGMAFGTSSTASPTGRSQIFEWDMVSTTTITDVIDWGEGALMALGTIEGAVVGVSDKYLSSSLGLMHGSMVVRLWAGGVPRVMKEVVSNQTVTLGRFLSEVVVKNNKMYWVASVPFGLSTSTESTFHLGIWVFGRKNANSNFTLSLDYIEPNISASNFYINSFGAAGDYWFINHSNDFSLTRTDDTATYGTTSIYDTQILNEGDSSITKKLVGVTLFTAPLPSGGSVTLKYRKNEESSYTTIFTYSAANGISHSAINVESTGATLPEYKELQFRIESTGGAEITGLKWKADLIDKDTY
jgi:hypothetical protein